MTDVMLSSTIKSKLKTRESANRIKHGSPKLQEVLRQRCRHRMQERRRQLFDKRRFGLEKVTEELHEALTEIVRKEISDLSATDWKVADNSFTIIDSPLDPDEALELENEIIAEQEQWVLEEYERMARSEDELLATFAEEGLKEQVVCPICQRAALLQLVDSIVCQMCGLSLSTQIDLADLGRLINESVNAHATNCNEPSCFMVLPENNNISLYLMCQGCSTFMLIA